MGPVKAFILAAGNGTRLRPLTEGTPKCLVPVAGVPMLRWWLDLCSGYGIEEITVNVHAHASEVRAFLEKDVDGSRVRVVEEPELLGSAGTLRANRDWIGRDEPFWVFYGDVLTNLDLERMYWFHKAKSLIATLALHESGNPRACGIAVLDESGVIQRFEEKPENPSSNLAFSGVMLASPDILDCIPDVSPADIGYHLLPQLAGNIAGYLTHEYLIDIGTLRTYEKAQAEWPLARKCIRSRVRANIC